MTEVDIELGRKKLAWARAHMPIHARLRARFRDNPPLAGITVAVCSHLEAKTGVFIETLAAAGANVVFTGSEPQSTQDDVVAALNEQPGLTGYARRGADETAFQDFHMAVLEHGPRFILDDAAELTARLVHHRPDLLGALIGTCEQTTTGVRRLQAMHAEGVMAFPSYAVNDAPMKHYFDNVHGTGESTLSNIAQATNLLFAGKHVVVAGYGYCGRGLAEKARGWNAQVTVTEVEPRRGRDRRHRAPGRGERERSYCQRWDSPRSRVREDRPTVRGGSDQGVPSSRRSSRPASTGAITSSATR